MNERPRYQGLRQQRWEARYQQCLEELGPPPGRGYVPMVGYTTARGIAYKSRWRRRPKKRRTR